LLGAKEPFAELVTRHWKIAVVLAARVLGSADLARDAAQEATVCAMTGLDRLRSPERFGAWFCGITLNVARSWLRQLRPENLGLPTDEVASDCPGPAEIAEIADLARRVRDAVTALPSGQRDAVLLFYLQGLSHREVAAELGMLLEERGGAGRLPIWIGPAEATAMALQLESAEWPRPMTYNLIASLLHAAGSPLREVRITRLIPPVYYATVIVDGPDGPDGPQEVDARPSDAVNLALVTSVPIRTDSRLFSKANAAHYAEVLSYPAGAAELAAEAVARQAEALREGSDSWGP
jgi:RNA polymerase sigma factor (sigma-70 family)